MNEPKDQQAFLSLMCKDQVDHCRHHEVQRQQSTALILSLATGTALVESGLLQAALRDSATLPQAPLIIGSLALFGLLIVVLAAVGYNLSDAHYRRSRQHATKARAYRSLLEANFPNEFKLTDLRNAQDAETKSKGRVFQQWRNIYWCVGVLGFALLALPIVAACTVKTAI